MLADFVQAGLRVVAQLLLPEHEHLLSAEETPETPELGAVKAAVDVGEHSMLQWQCFSAASFLLFERKVEGQWIVPPPVLHRPVGVCPFDRIAQNHNQSR